MTRKLFTTNADSIVHISSALLFRTEALTPSSTMRDASLSTSPLRLKVKRKTCTDNRTKTYQTPCIY